MDYHLSSVYSVHQSIFILLSRVSTTMIPSINSTVIHLYPTGCCNPSFSCSVLLSIFLLHSGLTVLHPRLRALTHLPQTPVLYCYRCINSFLLSVSGALINMYSKQAIITVQCTVSILHVHRTVCCVSKCAKIPFPGFSLPVPFHFIPLLHSTVYSICTL